MVDTHGVLHGLNALNTRVRRSNDQKAIQEILNAGFVLKRNRDGMAHLHPFAIVAQAQHNGDVASSHAYCFFQSPLSLSPPGFA